MNTAGGCADHRGIDFYFRPEAAVVAGISGEGILAVG